MEHYFDINSIQSVYCTNIGYLLYERKFTGVYGGDTLSKINFNNIFRVEVIKATDYYFSSLTASG